MIELKGGGFVNIDDNCNYFMDTNRRDCVLATEGERRYEIFQTT